MTGGEDIAWFVSLFFIFKGIPRPLAVNSSEPVTKKPLSAAFRGEEKAIVWGPRDQGILTIRLEFKNHSYPKSKIFGSAFRILSAISLTTKASPTLRLLM